MKIAIISFYNGNIDRGVESWTEELGSRLGKNHQLTVFQNGKAKNGIPYRVVATNIQLNPKEGDSGKTLKRMFFMDYWSLLVAKFTLKIIPILWKEDFDVYIPTNGGWQSVLIRFLSVFKNTKIVIVGHSGKGMDDRINLWTFPDVFIALTEDAARWAKKVNPFVKIEQIYNGIDLKKFTKKGPKLQIKFKNPLILAVGALNITKRIDLAIKAVSLIPNVDLLVVGGGDRQKEFEELGKKMLGDRFHLINVSYGQMPEVYRSARIFTLPSWEREAFGLVYLEALSSNLPVVATKDLVRQEIIGDAGVLTDPENLQGYAAALRQALQKDWGDKPRQQAEKFSWEKIADEYEKVLMQLVKK